MCMSDNYKSKHMISLEEWMPLIKEQLANGQSVHFSPKGKSMLPMLRENIDSVVLSPISGKLKKYDLPLYQRKNGQYVLHRIVEVKDTYTMLGDHQVMNEYGIKQEQLIGVVTGFYRNGKLHNVNETTYKIYCGLWYFCRRCVRWAKRKIKRVISSLM